jgi:hypothetical protein
MISHSLAPLYLHRTMISASVMCCFLAVFCLPRGLLSYRSAVPCLFCPLAPLCSAPSSDLVLCSSDLVLCDALLSLALGVLPVTWLGCLVLCCLRVPVLSPSACCVVLFLLCPGFFVFSVSCFELMSADGI